MKILILLPLIVLLNCTNTDHDIPYWRDQIPFEMELGKVKLRIKDSLKIDWNNPDTLDNGFTRYYLNKSDHLDVLQMIYFIEFKNNKYKGIFGRK